MYDGEHVGGKKREKGCIEQQMEAEWKNEVEEGVAVCRYPYGSLFKEEYFE